MRRVSAVADAGDQALEVAAGDQAFGFGGQMQQADLCQLQAGVQPGPSEPKITLRGPARRMASTR